MTSLGFYRTFSPGEETRTDYDGYQEDGVYEEKGHKRVRVRGLESTNNNAEKRDVLIHASVLKEIENKKSKRNGERVPYVSQAYIDGMGFLGESEGCFALDPSETDEINDHLEGAALVYAYSSLN